MKCWVGAKEVGNIRHQLNRELGALGDTKFIQGSEVHSFYPLAKGNPIQLIGPTSHTI